MEGQAQTQVQNGYSHKLGVLLANTKDTINYYGETYVLHNEKINNTIKKITEISQPYIDKYSPLISASVPLSLKNYQPPVDLIQFRTKLLEMMEKVFCEMEKLVDITFLQVGGVEEEEKNDRNFEMRVKGLLNKSYSILSLTTSSLFSQERRDEAVILSRVLFERFSSIFLVSSSLLLTRSKELIINLPEQCRTIRVAVPTWFTRENMVELGKRIKEECSREGVKKRMDELKEVEVKKNSLKLYNNVLERLVNASHDLQKMAADLKKEVESRKGKREIEMVEHHNHSD